MDLGSSDKILHELGFFRETEPAECVGRDEGREREELAQVIVGAGKCEICNAGPQPGDAGQS